jgi:hypothetical protein
MEQLRDSVEIVEDFTPRRPTAPVNHIIQHPAPAAADPVTTSFSLPGPKGPITTQILPTAPVTVGFSAKEAKPAISSITVTQNATPMLMSLPPSGPPVTQGYAPTETTPSLGTSYFSAGAPSAPTDWYLYPALPVPPATGGAVLFVDGSGQHVLESIAGNLFFDTELLAKASDIQDVADWSLYPALATVDVNGETLDVVGKLSFQTAVAGGAGLIENAQLISGDTNLPLDIATTGTGTLNFLTNTTTRATMTAGGTFQFLTSTPQTAIAPTTGDDLTNKTYVDGRITDVSDNLAALQLEVTDISGRVGTLETGLFDVSGRVASLETQVNDISAGLFDVSGRVAILEQQIIDVSGNIANWSLYPAVSTINADDNDIENVGSFTAGGILNSFQVGTALAPVASAIVRATNLELTSYNPLVAMSIAGAGGINMTGTDDINITANDVNISAIGTTDILNLTAVAGIAINAGAGVEIGAVGTIQILSTGNVSIGSGNVLGADTEVEKFAFNDERMYKVGLDDLELEDIGKINGLTYVPTQSWATQVATADVNFTEPSFPLPIVHNIVGLGKINGTTYAPTSSWSSFAAGSTVDIASYPIINVTTINGTTYTPGSSWSSFPATQNVSFGGFNANNLSDLQINGPGGATVQLISNDANILNVQTPGGTLQQMRLGALNLASGSPLDDTVLFRNSTNSRIDVLFSPGPATQTVAYLSDIPPAPIIVKDQTEFFVSAQGSNSYNGGVTQPFLTIQFAIDQAALVAASGNSVIINVAPGVYTENLTFTTGYITLASQATNENLAGVVQVNGTVTVSVGGANDLFGKMVSFIGFQLGAVLDNSTAQHSLAFQSCYLFAGSGGSRVLYVNSTSTDQRVYLQNCTVQSTGAATNAVIEINNPTSCFLELDKCDIVAGANIPCLLMSGASRIQRCALCSFANNTSGSNTMAPLITLNTTGFANSVGNNTFLFNTATAQDPTNPNICGIFFGAATLTPPAGVFNLFCVQNVFVLTGTTTANHSIAKAGPNTPTVILFNNGNFPTTANRVETGITVASCSTTTPHISMTQQQVVLAPNTANMDTGPVLIGSTALGNYSIGGHHVTTAGIISSTKISVPNVYTYVSGGNWYWRAEVAGSTSNTAETWTVEIVQYAPDVSVATGIVGP